MVKHNRQDVIWVQRVSDLDVLQRRDMLPLCTLSD